jgi:arsenate reductase
MRFKDICEQMKKVLFLCTGNSCRSQMAEAMVNARLGDRWQAFSAGTSPAGYVHPMAIQVLQEIGIEHRGRSKSIEEIRDIPFDLVVTVCDSAAEECPLWLGSGKRIHMGFPDPARIAGKWEEVLAEFRSVRDEIMEGILRLLASGEDAASIDHEG